MRVRANTRGIVEQRISLTFASVIARSARAIFDGDATKQSSIRKLEIASQKTLAMTLAKIRVIRG